MTWLLSNALMKAFVNSHSSPEQVAESSAVHSSAGELFALLNGNPTRQVYSSDDKMTELSIRSRSGMTCKHLTADHGEVVLTWFLGASLVKTSQPLAKELGSPVLAQDYGVRWRELFTKYNHDSHLWKTPPSLWDEGLTSSLPTLPRWGLMQDGELWERVTLTRLIKETAYGSLPTPVKYDTGGRGEGDNYHGLGWQARYVGDVTGPAGNYPKGFKPSEGDDMSANTPQIRRVQMWPTPVAHEDRASKYRADTSFRHFQEGRQTHLAQHVRDSRMWPTPMTGGMESGGGSSSKLKYPLIEALKQDAAKQKNLPTPTSENGLRNSSQSEHFPGKWKSPGHPEYGELSADWVEWIMNWPIGWTAAAPLPPSSLSSWQFMSTLHGEDPEAEWWQWDPSDMPQSGITKTVKPGNEKEKLERMSRIAALGNGQVSSVIPAVFTYLWNLKSPKD